MQFRLIMLLALVLVPLALAHDEQPQTCSIDPNEPSGCAYEPGEPVSTATTLDIKDYHITFNKPAVLVNEETKLSIAVLNPQGQPATEHNVQVQIIDPATSQEIYYSESYETEPGTYEFRYEPSFAGDYYVQYLIRSGDDIIKPTFAITVTDPRAAYALYGLLAAGIFFALIGIGFSVKQSNIKPALTGIGFGALLVILGYGVSTFYAAGGERGFTVCGPDGCNLAVHWHSQLHITLCDEDYKLPLEAGDLNRVHTHKELNRLHYHALLKTDESGNTILEPEQLSLADFFTQLTVPFNATCFDGYCTGDVCPNGTPGALTMTVNDVPNTAFENYSYRDGDDIHLTFG